MKSPMDLFYEKQLALKEARETKSPCCGNCANSRQDDPPIAAGLIMCCAEPPKTSAFMLPGKVQHGGGTSMLPIVYTYWAEVKPSQWCAKHTPIVGVPTDGQ